MLRRDYNPVDEGSTAQAVAYLAASPAAAPMADSLRRQLAGFIKPYSGQPPPRLSGSVAPTCSPAWRVSRYPTSCRWSCVSAAIRSCPSFRWSAIALRCVSLTGNRGEDADVVALPSSTRTVRPCRAGTRERTSIFTSRPGARDSTRSAGIRNGARVPNCGAAHRRWRRLFHRGPRTVRGADLEISEPRNAFMMPVPGSGSGADKLRFLAGGIGITPILPMVRLADRLRVPWSSVYAGRHRDSLPFVDELSASATGSGYAPTPNTDCSSPRLLDGVDGAPPCSARPACDVEANVAYRSRFAPRSTSNCLPRCRRLRIAVELVLARGVRWYR